MSQRLSRPKAKLLSGFVCSRNVIKQSGHSRVMNIRYRRITYAVECKFSCLYS
ncbi:hypothetical protein XENTR_v10003721 [Xenopus tropicalis]|nr:hypothetical protein XENTR_v10003721 [Xenopus tropicalis]